jgi:hypothetical protein
MRTQWVPKLCNTSGKPNRATTDTCLNVLLLGCTSSPFGRRGIDGGLIRHAKSASMTGKHARFPVIQEKVS